MVPRFFLLAAAVALLAGCDKVSFDRSDRAFEQAEQKRGSQDYRAAVAFYEKALKVDKKAPDAHFRMGMIYDANLDDPVGAVHHFKRYMEMQPNGPHAKEARANLDRIELKLATSLAGGTLITHAEAAKLRQENKDLRDQLAQRPGGPPPPPQSNPTPPPSAALPRTPMESGRRASRAPPRPPATPPAITATPRGPAAGKQAARDAQLHPAPGTRTYVVQPGDSLASIARKFYKNKARAKDIQDANLNSVPDERKLKPGMTLIIP